MAVRPIFIPSFAGQHLVERRDVEFKWFPGMSVAQKQRSIASLHQAASLIAGVDRVLEISSKSEAKIGVALSAFNLSFLIPNLGRRMSVENAYQGSKVFEYGGPYTDLYARTAREAKRDERLRTSGTLVGFRFFGRDWPLEPPTAFYDWLYIQSLLENAELAVQMERFAAFTDIEFNPEKSINCQAHSAALFVALRRRGLLFDAIASPDAFVSVVQSPVRQTVGDGVVTMPRLF